MQTTPRYSLNTDWQLQDDNWKPGMDMNFLLLDAMMFATVISDQETTPPTAPNNGDCYIPGENSVDTWTGKDGNIVYYWDGAWITIEPRIGMVVSIIGQEIYRMVYTVNGWVMRPPSILTQPLIRDNTLTVPPTAPNPDDIYIPATGATGDWTGHDNEYTIYMAEAWRFFKPVKGHIATLDDTTMTQIQFDGNTWV